MAGSPANAELLAQNEPTGRQSSQEPAPPPDSADRPLVEVGWVLTGDFTDLQRRAVRHARGAWLRIMRDTFGEFDWRAPLLDVPAPDRERPAVIEPVALLDLGVQERDSRHWDAALVFTPIELMAYEKPVALGAPAAAIACGAISLARLGDTCEDESDDDCREAVQAMMSRRIVALAAHIFGHIGGLSHCDDASSFMHPPDNPADLDRPSRYTQDEAEHLRTELTDIADPRLEEQDGQVPHSQATGPAMSRFRGRLGILRFALSAAWQNRDDVWRAVRKAQPWMIPLRLGRLMTAASSALVILIMTAEVWEAGMSQPPWRVILLSLLAIITTSGYLLHRQRLLLSRPRRRSMRLSEQRSIGNVAIMLAVGMGMLTTYAALFTATVVAAWTFYPAALVREWAASVPEPVRWPNYLTLAGSVASLGLVIGALGASFEPRGYVRHVAYVDEET